MVQNNYSILLALPKTFEWVVGKIKNYGLSQGWLLRILGIISWRFRTWHPTPLKANLSAVLHKIVQGGKHRYFTAANRREKGDKDEVSNTLV